MPYETLLTGQDPFDRTYQPDMEPTDPSVYGNLPGEVSRDEAAQKAARRRQILAALAGGLSAPRQGGGFLGGLAAGFSGAVQGSMAYADKTQEVERQRARDEAANRQRQEADIKWQLMFQNQRAQQQETVRHNRATEGRQPRQMSELELFLTDPSKYQQFKTLGRAPADNESELELTPDALKLTARIFAQTGQTPALGYGKAGTRARSRIINEAARAFPNVDPVSNKAELDRNRTSLTNVSKIYDAASAWESTAAKNADVMLKVLDKIPDTGTRFGNKLARSAKSQLGDPDMAAFNTARETIKVEYARLLSSPGVGNSVLSDAARKEVEGILGGDLTREQLRRSLDVLKQDAKNRKNAYSGQIREIKGRIKLNELGSQAPASEADPLDRFVK